MTTASTTRWTGRGAVVAARRVVVAWVGLGCLAAVAEGGRDAGVVYGPVPEAASGAAMADSRGTNAVGESVEHAPSVGLAEPRPTPPPHAGEGDTAGAARGTVQAESERMPLGVPAGAASGAGGGARDPAASLVPEATDLAPTLMALAGVVGLIVLLGAGIRLARGGRSASIDTARAPSGILEVLGRYPISGGATLVLLRAHRRILLISQSRASRLGGSTLTTLAEFESVEDVAAVLSQARDARDESISARFTSLLAGFSAEHGTKEHEATLPPRGSGWGRDEVLVEEVPEGFDTATTLEPPVVEVRRRAAGSLLRRRLDDLRAWEGATA